MANRKRFSISKELYWSVDAEDFKKYSSKNAMFWKNSFSGSHNNKVHFHMI